MVNESGRPGPPRMPPPLSPSKYHTVPGARIGKEGPIPGYTGTIPAYRNHIIGHGYSDGSRRAAALTDSMRHNKIENAYHLVCLPACFIAPWPLPLTSLRSSLQN